MLIALKYHLRIIFCRFMNSPSVVMYNFNNVSCNDPILKMIVLEKKFKMTALVQSLGERGPFCKILTKTV